MGQFKSFGQLYILILLIASYNFTIDTATIFHIDISNRVVSILTLQDLTLKTEYRKSKGDWIVEDFLIPILENAVSYDRAVGYFSSSALLDVSKGITGLFNNNPDAIIRLVVSPALSDEDVNAIKEGYDLRKKIEEVLIRELRDPVDYFEEERLNLLANLIAEGKLEIKVATLIGDEESPYGIFHEKLGIVEDEEGNVVSFTGSMNATGAGHKSNYESVDVFCNWKSEESMERCIEKKRAFNMIWTNKDSELEVQHFSKVDDRIIEKYKRSAPNYNIDKEQYKPRKPVKKQLKEAKGARIPDSVTLEPYQKEAIDNWETNGFRGIFDMATGTGKTYTGLGAIARLSERLEDKLAVVIAVPFQHLVDQWVEDIEKFNMKPIIGYSSSPQKDWKKRLTNAIRVQNKVDSTRFFCFVCTNATFLSDFVQKEISKIEGQVLLVADEAHNFGAQSFNAVLDNRFDYRLALSATIERFRDEAGTDLIKSFFGEKCIEYSLEQAIKENKLCKYKYYPVVTYLNSDELSKYESLTNRIRKCVVQDQFGKTALNEDGKKLAIQRARLVAGASQKIEVLKEVIEPYKYDSNILVYCGATTVTTETEEYSTTDQNDKRQVDAVAKMLGIDLDMAVARFTSMEDIGTRNEIKRQFVNGLIQAVVAIKCLDEGVNIPGIKTAFILASTTNPKEYIQRRGRVLRKADGKEYAEIYDFVTLPHPLEDISGFTIDQLKKDISLVRNELFRLKEFAKSAMNPSVANDLIWKLEDAYYLDELGIIEEGDII